MRQSLKAYMMILALCALSVKAQEKVPLKLITRTPMPGFTGDFDHFGLDLKGNRLFLAAEEHKTVEVFDLRTGARAHSIEGFGHPLMMVYLPESNQLVVTDGDNSAVQLVDCTQYKIIKTIKLSPDVNHGVLNPVNKYYYVESGGGSNSPTHVLSIIDTKSFRYVGDVEGLPGSSSEGMVIDRAGKKLYVNLTGTDEVGVVDLNTRQLVAKWALPGHTQPMRWRLMNPTIEFLSPPASQHSSSFLIPTRVKSWLLFRASVSTATCRSMSRVSESM